MKTWKQKYGDTKRPPSNPHSVPTHVRPVVRHLGCVRPYARTRDATRITAKQNRKNAKKIGRPVEIATVNFVGVKLPTALLEAIDLYVT